MSSITTEHGIIHYEAYGKGKPVILLHGWGACGLWQETMMYLGHYYRTYALDFWGSGKPGHSRSSFAVQNFAGMVKRFMDHLGIMAAPLVGHGMGGTVSLLTALKYPACISKTAVIGAPLVGSSLALPLKAAGWRSAVCPLFVRVALFRLWMRLSPAMLCADPRFRSMMDGSLSKTTLESFLASIASLRTVDLRRSLPKLQGPVMGMFGDRDVIVNPNQWKVLKDSVPQARIERYPSAGHFIMLDEPRTFMTTLKEFLDKMN